MFATIILKIAVNAIALWASTRYIAGFSIAPVSLIDLHSLGISAMAQSFVLGGFGFAIINGVLKPILKVVGEILPLITFGVLSVALNFLLLYLAAIYFPQFIAIAGFKPLIFSAILIGIMNAIF